MTKRQRKLFSGMDCLPGQQDLFRVDGDPEPAPPKPPAPAYTCPNGHRVTWNHRDDDTAPTCHRCGVIATHYNDLTKDVYTWTDTAEHRAACERLQDEIDAAFDHQYFSEW